jgi:hypothetical protein
MGGPWRDAEVYREPRRPDGRLRTSEATVQPVTGRNGLTQIVLTYVAAVATSLVLMLWAMRQEW